MALTAAEVLALVQQAGPGGDPATAAAVALAESSGDPGARNVNADGSVDRGLWQINSRWHPEVSDACAYDPTCCAGAAYGISAGWTDFGAWTTYQSGAYRAHLDEVRQVAGQATLFTAAAPESRSLAGQQVVGQTLSSPWFPGAWEVTQGWGQTDYDGEPEGHGYQHWHAGVDVGLDCGTVITLPAGLTGEARSLDNPGGYGTALVVLLDGGPGILLGHLRQRLVDDGARLQGPQDLAVSNNTGNSTGCHTHFEVRPQDPKQPLGIARYGNDVDPSSWLLYASGSPTDAQLLSTRAGAELAIAPAISGAFASILNGGQVLLGAGLVVAGLVATAYGLRGGTPQGLQRDTRTTLRRLNRPRHVQPQPAPQRPSPAAESRVRPDLQRPQEAAPR